MSIHNQPRITSDKTINQMRYLIEQRAEWMYEFCTELKKQGLDYEAIARTAIHRFGCRRGSNTIQSLPQKGHSLVELADSFRNNPTTIVFEKEYICTTEEKFETDFHYCPLLAAWQKLVSDEEQLALLCDIAMEGDRGLFGSIPDTEFILASTLAKGDPVCKLIIQKKLKTSAEENV